MYRRQNYVCATKFSHVVVNEEGQARDKTMQTWGAEGGSLVRAHVMFRWVMGVQVEPCSWQRCLISRAVEL